MTDLEILDRLNDILGSAVEHAAYPDAAGANGIVHRLENLIDDIRRAREVSSVHSNPVPVDAGSPTGPVQGA